ncbi:hypothetical protein ES708_30193 [subsurface metagenome]
MAVYDRVDKRRRALINAQKRYRQDLIINWKIGGIPKTTLIKMMVEALIADIKIRWTTKKLKMAGYIGYKKGD